MYYREGCGCVSVCQREGGWGRKERRMEDVTQVTQEFASRI